MSDDIRHKIETGDYLPGAKLPPMPALCDHYMCSLAVIRKAIELLQQQGLVFTVQGKGTFVRQIPTARRHGIERYARSKWGGGKAILVAEAEAQGRSVRQELRGLEEVSAPLAVAERLNQPEGSLVWARRRTTFVDGRPNQLADSFYPQHVAEAVPALKQEDTGPGGGFARIEEAGIQLSEIAEEWRARMPLSPEAVALQLLPGTPVIDLIRTTFDAQQQPVEVMIAVLAADMTSFTYRFPIPD